MCTTKLTHHVSSKWWITEGEWHHTFSIMYCCRSSYDYQQVSSNPEYCLFDGPNHCTLQLQFVRSEHFSGDDCNNQQFVSVTSFSFERSHSMVNSWWVTTHHFEPQLVKYDLQHMTDRMLVYSFAMIQWESIKFDFNRMLVIAHLSCWAMTSHFIPWPTESGWQCVPFESSNHYYCNQQQVCGSAYISETYVYSGLIIYASMMCRK
jgi:hypothetical protein